MSGKDWKIAIVGAGPVGGILGTYLTKENIDVTLVDIWKDHMKAIQENGFHIGGVDNLVGYFDADHLKLAISELKGVKPDLVFIATKASSLEPVANELKKVLHDKALIISHQNGVGNEEVLIKYFGDKRVFRVVINYAGNIIEPGKVDMTLFIPPNIIGAVSSKNHAIAKSIAELLSKTGLTTEFQEKYQSEVWKKAVLNASMGTLCAITGMTVGEAMDFPNTRDIVSYTLKEALAVAEKIGFTYEPDFYDKCMAYLSKGGRHKPSTLIDVETRKPTEIDFLSATIMKLGKKHGVPVPFNEAITALLKALDLLNKRDQDYINAKAAEKGLKESCLDCYYAKDCIDVFHYCPYSGKGIMSN
jgi:2-dehydropantoate 2-reductase